MYDIVIEAKLAVEPCKLIGANLANQSAVFAPLLPRAL